MATPTTQQLLEEYTGKVVPYTFNGGFVCLSYAISLVGTGTALELIRRRTSHRGKHNFFLLVGAAIAMGGIAIWSMHFIGNRAIYMLNGEAAFQIAYSTALTVASLLVPIFVLVLAFVGVNGNGRIQWWRIVLAGLLSGGAICGMHYLADASISNYRGSYRLSYLIGSIIIAVLASTTALTLFFVFENTWSSAWWKRLGCAMVLAGAVSGMHWCAAVGTSYTLLHDKPGKGVSRKDAMVVVICLSIAAGIVMTGMAIYSSWVRRDYASKSQQVVLAAGVFDDKGRIMVSQDGYLPSEVVTDTYFTKSNDDVFSTSHPLFHWMFRASRNWDTITKVMTKMTTHISLLAQEHNIGSAGVQLISDDGELVDEYDTILRELFCVTADALASKTKETLAGVGTLWDEIFVTGESSRAQRLFNNDKPGLQSLAEKGIQQNGQEYGRGSLMFLVRRVDSRKEVVRLEASGFRFVEVHQVAPFIRSTMRIKTPDLEAHLHNMANQRDKTPMLSPGFHVGMFAVRARLDRGGFDVLAQKTARNLLPSVPLPVSTLDASNASFLNGLRGLPLSTILLKLQSYHSGSAQDRMFASILRDAVSSLRDSLSDETFDNATLLPKVVQLPCAPSTTRGKSLSKCILIAFQLVLPIHANVLSPDCVFTPLNFFKMRQLTYEGSPHNIEFSHMVHRDMSSTVHELSLPPRRFSVGAQVHNKLFSRAVGKVRDNLPGHKRHATALVLTPTRSQEQLSKSVSHPSSIYNGDNGSFDYACKLSSASQSHSGKDSHKDQGQKFHVFGGIMVSQEVSINVQDNQEDSNAPEQQGSELKPIRPRADAQGKMESFYTATATGESGFAGQGKQDESAFVDELLALSMQADKRATA
ncbi:Signaling protein YkoW [Trichoderma lentiforme]|uniref:Signaling protein YkoW n=1 Tax=Trichoderma lentiforme TaxID=1567552 RepID=A0A9P4X710_9HYPO|nr:Signaling protein YkoW [Trichoderma lentiforme]